MRLRNPKNDDLGDVISNEQDRVDTLFLYDNKELIVQLEGGDMQVC